MRGPATAIALAGAVLAALLLASVALPEGVCAEGCGILPIRPIPPIGCGDLCPQCQCDSNGQNCRWIWVCC